MKGTKRKFTLEFRAEAVRLVVQERMTVLEAARRLEISDKNAGELGAGGSAWEDAASGRRCFRSKGPFGERA